MTLLYLNVYEKDTGEIILKYVKNMYAYERWRLIDTYVFYENKLYKYDDFRKVLKIPVKKSFFSRVVDLIKEL